MKSLALRIYLAVVTALLLFALTVGWLAQRNLEHERQRIQSQGANNDRMVALGELIENSLPLASEPSAVQAQALLEWSQRLRVPMALDDPQGRRVAESPPFKEWRERWPQGGGPGSHAMRWADGRTLWVLRPSFRGPRPGMFGPRPYPPSGGPESSMGERRIDDAASRRADHERDHLPADPWLLPLAWMLPAGWAAGAPGLVVMLVLVFVAVAIGAWPVANRLTRRLKALRQGVERFGQGDLQQRVEVEGRDEVADVARSFNEAAAQIESLVLAHRSLLANASHELRSPLARMKMAVSMLSDMPPERAAQLKQEIHQDIHELDALVEEVLLASRLDARPELDKRQVDVMGLLIEEAQRTGAHVEVDPAQVHRTVMADERLLRRAVRNLLENARRYGGADVQVSLHTSGHTRGKGLEIVIADRGPGVPPEQRERIFEPFYRLPGHAEHAGGVGLGLSLVRQIADRHQGTVRCEPREGGGSRFVLGLPVG